MLSFSVLSADCRWEYKFKQSQVFKLNFVFVMYLLSLWKDSTSKSFHYSLFMLELLNNNIKRVKHVLNTIGKYKF